MKLALHRIVPVGLALTPVGVLFGILAAQANWSALDVFLLSVIGFTGSGQFAFLIFSNQGLGNVGIFIVFLIILSINLRYIPMAMSVSQPLQTSIFKKFLLAHWLADESYATELIGDDLNTRAIIRISIVLFWAASTVSGVMLASILPKSIGNSLAGLTFPISTILVALSFSNIKNYIVHKLDRRKQHLIQVISCFIVAVLLMWISGIKYFWIPSIILSYLILKPKSFRKKSL